MVSCRMVALSIGMFFILLFVKISYLLVVLAVMLSLVL